MVGRHHRQNVRIYYKYIWDECDRERPNIAQYRSQMQNGAPTSEKCDIDMEGTGHLSPVVAWVHQDRYRYLGVSVCGGCQWVRNQRGWDPLTETPLPYCMARSTLNRFRPSANDFNATSSIVRMGLFSATEQTYARDNFDPPNHIVIESLLNRVSYTVFFFFFVRCCSTQLFSAWMTDM